MTTDPSRKKGYVYKLCYDDESCVYYIGSTIRDLKRRLTEHKREIKTGRGSKKKIELFKDRIEDLKMILIEECVDMLVHEIRFRERYWLEKLKSIVNIMTPIRSKGEYERLYYLKNKARINAHKSQQVECDICGNFVSRRHLARHKKSQKCIKISLITK